MSAADVYRKQIFPNFHYLTVDAALVHMRFVRDRQLARLSGAERAELAASLRELAFIPLDDGRFHRAAEFFDPHHPVFKVRYDTIRDASYFNVREVKALNGTEYSR